MSGGLVVLQMALSIILLISSGLFIRALKSATEIDPGMDAPKNLVMASLDPGLQGLDEPQTRQFYDRLAEELAARPNVTAVGFTNSVPLGFSNSDRGVDIPGYEFAEGERQEPALLHRHRRLFGDDGGRPARGKNLHASGQRPPELQSSLSTAASRSDSGPTSRRSARSSRQREKIEKSSVSSRPGSTAAWAKSQPNSCICPSASSFGPGSLWWCARLPIPQAVLQGVRETVRGLDENMPLFDVRTMEDHMGIALLPARLGGSVLGIFGVLGLLLAAVGIYGRDGLFGGAATKGAGYSRGARSGPEHSGPARAARRAHARCDRHRFGTRRARPVRLS